MAGARAAYSHTAALAVDLKYLKNDKKKSIISLFLGRDRWKAYQILRKAGLPSPLTQISAAKIIDALIKRRKVFRKIH